MSRAERIQRHLKSLPPALQNEVLDFVLFLEQRVAAGQRHSPDAERAARLDAALEKLAALNPFAEVDPEQWQREVRADRMVVGRE